MGISTEKPYWGKCFSGLIRGLLCNRSLPTHPSDHDMLLFEHKSKDVDHPEQVSKTSSTVRAASTPGVVARLMGLDSLPDFNNLPPKQTKVFGSFLRSRSVNSLDYPLPAPAPFDFPKKLQHRRVKTSISFHEVPASLREGGRHHDEHLFVVRFEETNKEKEQEEEKGLRVRKPEVVGSKKRVVQSKVYYNNGVTIIENNSTKRVDTRSSSIKFENVRPQRKIDSKRITSLGLKGRRLVKEADSREAPLRLGFKKLRNNKGLCNNKTQPTYERVTKPGKSSPTCPKDSSAQKIPDVDGSPCNNKLKGTAGSNFEEPIKATLETDYNYRNMLTDICRLPEDDIEGTSWVDCKIMLSLEDLEEICHHFGEMILELLLNQAVDELLKLQS